MITKEQLLSEIEDLLRTMPDRATIRHHVAENEAWLGRSSSLVQNWSIPNYTSYLMALQKFRSSDAREAQRALSEMVAIIHQARHDLMMNTIGPLSVSISQGRPFDYFDEIRKIISAATNEVFFIDPYLDADFIDQYLPHIKPHVKIRLLGGTARKKTFVPAIKLYMEQEPNPIEVKLSKTGMHDRYIFVDNNSCYHSGTSFKDGTRKSPTTLSQITDASAVLKSIYENQWSEASSIDDGAQS